LSKDRWPPEELAQLIVATVQDDLATGNDVGLQALDDALNGGCADLFDDGEEKMQLALCRIQDGPLSVAARTTCEIALGVLATQGMSDSFRNQVTKAVREQHARDQFEHMVSRITSTHGVAEASQVRSVLDRAFALCDFTSTVGRSPKRVNKSVDELLSTELQLGL
jgi:hypothetical protein